MSNICDGIEERTYRMLSCSKCKKKRKHELLWRYDSVVFRCGKCKLTTVTGP